jgi:hypothetical protein
MPRRLLRREWWTSFLHWWNDGPYLTRRQFSAVFTVLLLLVTLALAGEGLLARANRNRIDDIQTSRRFSCVQTYSKMLEVLKASAAGRHLTPAQTRRVDRLEGIVDPTQCERQTRIPRVRGRG